MRFGEGPTTFHGSKKKGIKEVVFSPKKKREKKVGVGQEGFGFCR
jgi:hypothetical protein